MLTDILLGHALAGEYVFVLLCCGAAWMIGRAVAGNWQGLGTLVFYLLLLGAGSRFLHWALYQSWAKGEGTASGAVSEMTKSPIVELLTYYSVDTVVFLLVGYLGYMFTRTNQMTQQYKWLYEKATPVSWRERT